MALKKKVKKYQTAGFPEDASIKEITSTDISKAKTTDSKGLRELEERGARLPRRGQQGTYTPYTGPKMKPMFDVFQDPKDTDKGIVYYKKGGPGLKKKKKVKVPLVKKQAKIPSRYQSGGFIEPGIENID